MSVLAGLCSSWGVVRASCVALALLCSLGGVGSAACSLRLYVDAAVQAILAGATENTAWYIAFGLTVTLVWWYLEILRLLSYFQSE